MLTVGNVEEVEEVSVEVDPGEESCEKSIGGAT